MAAVAAPPVNPIFDTMDRNHDGQITKEEFMSMSKDQIAALMGSAATPPGTMQNPPVAPVNPYASYNAMPAGPPPPASMTLGPNPFASMPQMPPPGTGCMSMPPPRSLSFPAQSMVMPPQAQPAMQGPPPAASGVFTMPPPSATMPPPAGSMIIPQQVTPPTTSRETDKIFDAIDGDKNGVITKEEFIKTMTEGKLVAVGPQPAPAGSAVAFASMPPVGALPPPTGAMPPFAASVPPPAGVMPPMVASMPPLPYASMPAGAMPPIGGSTTPPGAFTPRSASMQLPVGAMPPPTGPMPPPTGAMPQSAIFQSAVPAEPLTVKSGVQCPLPPTASFQGLPPQAPPMASYANVAPSEQAISFASQAAQPASRVSLPPVAQYQEQVLVDMQGTWALATVVRVNATGTFCVMIKSTGAIEDNVPSERIKAVTGSTVVQAPAAVSYAEPAPPPIEVRQEALPPPVAPPPLAVTVEEPAPVNVVTEQTYVEPKEDVLMEASKLFELLDRNRDGYISRAEFERLLPWEQRQLYLVLKKRGNEQECPLM